MVIAIVVDEDWWLSCISSSWKQLNSWRDVWLSNTILKCWVDDLHYSSFTTNCPGSIRSGSITPGVEVTCCLSLLPNIFFEILLSFKRLLSVLEDVLKNFRVPIFLNPIATPLSQLIMSIWRPMWILFITSQSNTDWREEAIAISFNGNQLSSSVKTFSWTKNFIPVAFVCQPCLELPPMFLSYKTMWLVFFILRVHYFVFVNFTKCKRFIICIISIRFTWTITFIRFGVLKANHLYFFLIFIDSIDQCLTYKSNFWISYKQHDNLFK